MKANKTARKAGAILLALALWQIAAMAIHQSIVLVSPIDVIRRLGTIWKEEGFFYSIWFTFSHIMLGFVISVVFGILLAALAYRFSLAETLLWPYITAAKTVPVASLVVILLIWLSSRNLSVFIVCLVAIPLVYQNVLTGLRSQDPQMKEMARVFRIPRMRRIRYILVPQVYPFLYAACKVAVGMAWKAGVAAEIIGTPPRSIGKQVYIAKMYLDTDDLFAWTVVIVVLSIMTEKLFLALMRRIKVHT